MERNDRKGDREKEREMNGMRKIIYLNRAIKPSKL